MIKFFPIYFLFIIILAIWYFFVNTENSYFYRQIIVTFFSLHLALIIYFIYNYFFSVKLFCINRFKKVNIFIDKYLIYILLWWFFIFINYITFSKHFNFHTYWFDLWIFDQAVYNYSQNQFPAWSSIRDLTNIEADHFHPILIFYSLFYKIYASPLVLIFLQNLFFVLWWFWIYKISKFKLNIPIIWFWLVFLYLIFRWNANALLFDFHPIVIAVSLFPWLFYFSIKKKWIYYFLLLIPILLSKENLCIYIVFFWIYQFFIQKERLIWLASFLIWASYFYLVMNYFMPLMWADSWIWYWSYDEVWANPKELIINFFTDPINFFSVVFSSITKIVTYLHHLWSGLYLAIFTPLIFFLIPSYAQKFISTREEFWTLNFHYSIDVFWVIAIWIIFFFVFIKSRFPKKHIDIILILWLFIFINSFIINIYKSPLLKLNYSLENKETLLKFIDIIPTNSSISTQNAIAPHFSHNKETYIFPNLWNSQYVLLNKNITNYWPLDDDKALDRYILNLKNKKDFEKITTPFFKDRQSIWRKYDLIKEENWVFLFKLVN